MSDYPECATCGKRKQPIGRDLASVSFDSWCVDNRDGFGCDGYYQEPRPVTYWPEEDKA